MTQQDQDELLEMIRLSLEQLEQAEEIVICASTAQAAARKVFEKTRHIALSDQLSASELRGIRSFILHAREGRIDDWEMHTLTGLTPQQLSIITEKLPRE